MMSDQQKTNIPNFLTPEKAIELFAKIMMSSVIKIRQALQALKRQGEDINFNNPRVQEVMKTVNLLEMKYSILHCFRSMINFPRRHLLEEEGVNKFQGDPITVFHNVAQFYSTENTNGFKDKMAILELSLQQSVEAILSNPELSTEAITDHFKQSPQKPDASQNPKTDIPSFLTPERTLRIYEEIMKTSVSEIKHTLQDLKGQGEEIKLNNDKVLAALHSVDHAQIKWHVMQEEGVKGTEEETIKILNDVSQEYAQENPTGFGKQLKGLELKHQQAVAMVLQNPEISEDFVNQEFKGTKGPKSQPNAEEAKKEGI